MMGWWSPRHGEYQAKEIKMTHADLVSRSKERSGKMTGRELLQQAFGLTLIVLLLSGCGGAPTGGTITGMVLDNGGKPLGSIHDEETLLVALFCTSDESDAECLREDFWDMDIGVLFDSICEAGDTASDCVLHVGQGAAQVEADGSYTIADVPPGQYGLVFMFRAPGLMQTSINRDVGSVEIGEITEYDIATELLR
jgi:hypothetical protein